MCVCVCVDISFVVELKPKFGALYRGDPTYAGVVGYDYRCDDNRGYGDHCDYIFIWLRSCVCAIKLLWRDSA